MTWSTPLTAVSNAALTAAQWNGSVRDNLLATAPALATTAGYHFASTGTNSIAERAIKTAQVPATETTPSTTYTDLGTAGPSVTLTTGTSALVWAASSCSNSGANASIASVNITGATSSAPSIDEGVTNLGTSVTRATSCCLYPLTAGSNTFAMQYRVIAGTGSFGSRRITVMGL
jgi:hypothetical protein